MSTVNFGGSFDAENMDVFEHRRSEGRDYRQSRSESPTPLNNDITSGDIENKQVVQLTSDTDQSSSDNEIPPSHQPDPELDSGDIGPSLTHDAAVGTTQLGEPSTHPLAREAAYTGVSIPQLLTPSTGEDVQNPSLPSADQPRDASRKNKRGQDIAIYEDAQEHQMSFSRNMMNRLQNSRCVDYPKENQHNGGHEEEPRYQGDPLSHSLEVPGVPQAEIQEQFNNRPQGNLDRQIHSEFTSS